MQTHDAQTQTQDIVGLSVLRQWAITPDGETLRAYLGDAVGELDPSARSAISMLAGTRRRAAHAATVYAEASAKALALAVLPGVESTETHAMLGALIDAALAVVRDARDRRGLLPGSDPAVDELEAAVSKLMDAGVLHGGAGGAETEGGVA